LLSSVSSRMAVTATSPANAASSTRSKNGCALACQTSVNAGMGTRSCECDAMRSGGVVWCSVVWCSVVSTGDEWSIRE
jgi:hypothetical protein